MGIGRQVLLAAICLVLVTGCTGDGGPSVLTADVPLHLETSLESATIEGSEVPGSLPLPREWNFDESCSEWSMVTPVEGLGAPVQGDCVGGALRLTLDSRNRISWGRLLGGVFVELGELNLRDWGYVEVRARTSDRMHRIGLDFNYTEDDPANVFPFYTSGDRAYVATDGTIQTYRLSLDEPLRRDFDGPWTHLGLWFNTVVGVDSATFDILSVRIVPKEAKFAASGVGQLLERRRPPGDESRHVPYRRAMYIHAPGRVSFRVRIPEAGRLNVGLGVLRSDDPVDFTVSVTESRGPEEPLLEETYADPSRWGDRSVDLSRFAGRTVTLTLGAGAEREGTVALWAVPTLSGTRKTDKPNVIFYVIDGGSPDYMSLYGYNRRTTPHLERIAAEGAVFENAYSNSGWTRPSTPSFLTSLQHSVLGGLRNGRNPVPDQAPTMAELLHRAGYQTALLTSNANAGRMSNLDRGCDLFRDAGLPNYSASSVWLHENFWNWREAYPAEPYEVHFQTTDVHNDHTPAVPFAGLYVSPERRRIFEERLERANEVPETDEVGIREALDQLDIDPLEFWTTYRDLHDETMAHQDYQLGQLVDRLKASGEWERTLLIVAADHGVAAGAWDYRLMMRDPSPAHVYHDDTGTPMLRPGVSRIPLIVVWPERIPAGLRIDKPVSMIDVLPTVLDFAELPMPEFMMGQSLAPLMLGTPGWEPRPVILDAFEVNEQGELSGRIEVVDGRWGASLLVNPDPDIPESRRRPSPILVFDLWEDPDCLDSLHDRRPDLADRYTRFLTERLEIHKALATRFTRADDSPLTAEQLEALRSLGYIQ